MYTFEMVKEVEKSAGIKFDVNFEEDKFSKIFFDELESLKDQNKRQGIRNSYEIDKKIVLERIIDWVKYFDYDYVDSFVKNNSMSRFLTDHRFGYALLSFSLYEMGWNKPE